MLRLADIEDALLADLKTNVTGIKTCETHEKEFDDSLISSLLPKSPFVLIRYGGTTPNDAERLANEAAGISKREFHITVGAQSLRSKKEAQRGCYDILDDLRERYNGFNLSISGESITLSYDGDYILSSGGGLVVYKIYFKWDEN